MQRIIIVYNPRSSKHARIEQEVLAPARELRGYSLGKFEVKKVPLDENAERLSKVLLDGDLVVAAGGDGTGSVALNGAELSGRDVALAVLGYGNFNDFARTLGQRKFSEIIADFESGEKLREFYPLRALVNGKHYRYAACYFTVGMFAESTEIFEGKTMRGKLKTGKKGLVYSVRQLAGWYFRNKKRAFLPGSFTLNGAEQKKASDLLFINGKTVAKMMRGGKFWQNPREILVSSKRLTSFFKLVFFMARSVLCRVPGEIMTGEVRVEFPEETGVEIQGEGEYRKVKLKSLTVKKAERAVKVLAR